MSGSSTSQTRGLLDMMNFDSTSKMSKEAMDSMLTTVSSMTKGFQQIAAESTEYSKKSYEDSAAVIEKLASAH